MAKVKESKPNPTGTFEVPDHMTSANILMAKTRHMAKFRICEIGKWTLPLVGGTESPITMGVDTGRGEKLGTTMKCTTGDLLGYNYYISPTHKVHSNLSYYPLPPKNALNPGPYYLCHWKYS